MIPGDQSERDRALASAGNVAVTAGAGTGKTTLLVSKILRKVLEEGVDIRRVLALTFTEKAANEMRARVRERLEAKGRTEGLDRAEIGTIHSFCAHVLRQFPVEAGVAPDFQVDEGPAFRRLFERAWPRWLDGELKADAPRAAEWKEVLTRADLGTLEEIARGLASFAIPDERGDGEETLRRFMEGPRPPPKSRLERSVLRLAKDVRAVDGPFVARALDLLSGFARDFRRDTLARGHVSFEGMLSLVHDLLRNPDFPDVLERLREKYAVLLVDEFQDTDPVQGEIIQRLAEGPDGRLVPGKLFLVGDPKQSIYSFRGADIVACQGLAKRILDEGGESVVLRTNFRSHGGILDLVNAVFSKVIVENGLLQPRYEPIEPEEGREPALPGPPIEFVLIEGAGASASREAEAEAIAEWIPGRGVPFKDIALLFRALTDVSVYLEALRSRAIPYVIEGEKLFFGTTEVIDFVNLLRAVANPHDRIAVAGVLRSPFGALSDQDLYDRRKSRASADLPILGCLKRWHERSGRIGVPELIDLIFEESFALEIARAGYHGDQAVANLLKLRHKAAETEGQGGGTLREFLDGARRAIREMEEEGESPLADETLDAVRIMSIHRAKGLEFPVVILPDLHRQKAPSRDRAVRFDWPTRTLGVRLGDACDAGGAALAYLDRERRNEEFKRLLYVAMTRARESLLLLGSDKARAETYLDLLRPELEKRAKVTRRAWHPPVLRTPPAPAEGETPDWGAFVARWRDRAKRAEAAPEFTSPSALEVPVLETRATDVGTECHRILERLDFSAPAVPSGADPEAAEILRGFFESEAFREIAGSEILARELPFVYRRGGQIVGGAIDLVYRREGNVYVADYKTDKMVAPEEHALIREIYVEAVRRTLGVEPRFRLVYLRHGKMVEP